MSELDINFDEEIELIRNELINNDDFYKETKDHFEAVKNSRTSGTLSFVHLQTANLVSLKSNKLNLIKELINIKKTKADLQMKNDSNDDTGDSGMYKNIALQMFDSIISNRKDVSFNSLLINAKNNTSKIQVTKKHETDVDALLDQRLANEQEKEEEQTPFAEPEKEEAKTFFVTDSSGTLYCVDENYNIIEDAEIPDWDVIFKGHGEHLKAENQDGESIEIIEFSDDDNEEE